MKISTDSSEKHLVIHNLFHLVVILYIVLQRNISNIRNKADDGSIIFKQKQYKQYFEIIIEPVKNNDIDVAINWNITNGTKSVVSYQVFFTFNFIGT